MKFGTVRLLLAGLCLFSGSWRLLAAPDLAPPAVSVSGTTGTSISLSWTAVAGATGYRLYHGAETSPLYSGTALSYTHSGLQPGYQHRYRVMAYSGSGDNVYSPWCWGCTNLVLTITGSTASSISMSWTPGESVIAASGFKLYEGSGQTLLYSGTLTSYTHSGLAPGTQYCYQVKSNLSSIPPSGVQCGWTTLDQAPVLTVTGTTKTSVTLAWTPVPGASGYKLYAGSGKEPVYNGKETGYIHKVLPLSKPVCYTVCACFRGGDGPLSKPACPKGVRPLAPGAAGNKTGG